MLALGEAYLEDICFPFMDRYGEQVNIDGSYSVYIIFLGLNYLFIFALELSCIAFQHLVNGKSHKPDFSALL